MVAWLPLTFASATTTGNILLAICEAPGWGEGFCAGYISGFVSGESLGLIIGVSREIKSSAIDEARALDAAGKGANCVPDEATNQQLKDVVVKWLKDHPESRHEDAPLLIQRALSEAFPFPCPRSERR